MKRSSPTLLTSVVLILLLCQACNGDSRSPATVLSEETSFPEPTADIESTPTPLPRTKEIILDSQRRPPVDATLAALGGDPFVFEAWDPQSTVIYDVKTGEIIDLGPTLASGGDGDKFGDRVDFNRDSTLAVWVARDPTGREYVEILGLNDRQRTRIAVDQGTVFAGFNDDDTMGVLYRSATPPAVFRFGGTPMPYTPAPFQTPTVGPRTDELFIALPGYRLFARFTQIEPPIRRVVVVTASGSPLFEFMATWASPLGDDLLIESSPAGATPDARYSGSVNLHVMDLPSGNVSFVATVSRDYMVTGNDRFIIWSEGACTFPRVAGITHILDRQTGIARRLDIAIRGRFLAAGLFYSEVRGEDFADSYLMLFDPATLERRAIWRELVPMAQSSDGRYFSPYLRIQGASFCPP